jgi:hypothetical protein
MPLQLEEATAAALEAAAEKKLDYSWDDEEVNEREVSPEVRKIHQRDEENSLR